jgi:thioredoxin 1
MGVEEFEGSRDDFLQLLHNNPGVIIIKFHAEWCKPCNLIKDDVHNEFEKLPGSIRCLEVDVDEAFDLYAYMKSKKMVRGIPAILAYKKGNTSYISDHSISGSNMDEIKGFFNECKKMLN